MSTTRPLFQESTGATPAEVVATIVAEHTDLHDWPEYLAIADCSQDTIHRLRP